MTPTTPSLAPTRRARWLFRLLLGALLAATTFPALAFIPVQTYYVPLPEDELLGSFRAMTQGCSACANPEYPIDTLVSIVVSASGTQILYDQHEDGYEPDPSNPTQASTEIWGDGDLTNGVAPGTNDDLLDAGDVISLRNDVTLPSNQDLIDGKDKIVASFPVAVTRAAIPTGPGSLQAGAIEVFPTGRWGTDYVAPVGVDNRDDDQMFQYSAVYVMAGTDNTQCTIDRDPGRPGTTSRTLNQGETVVIENMRQGGTVSCDKNVHVDLITGDIGVNYATRWFALTATSRLTNDYYGPVGTRTRNGGETRIFVHNPTSSGMTVFCERNGGSCGSEFLSPGETWRSGEIPPDSGVRVYSNNPGDRFAAVSTTDFGGQIYDWGYTLEPRKELSSQVLVGLGLGCTEPGTTIGNDSCTGPNDSRSPIWVSPTRDTTIYVNRDGSPASCPGGAGADESRFVRALESVQFVDPNDNDMTGARIYSCDEDAPFVAAWGQDPDRSRSGDDQGIDSGTLIPPLPRVSATKFAALFIDADGDGDFSPGDTIRYSVRVSNNSAIALPINAFNVQDALPAAASYVASSTTYQADDGTSAVSVPDDNSGTPFPLDGAGKNNLAVLDGNQAATFQFDVLIDVARGDCDDDFVNTGEVRFPVDSDDPIDLLDRRRLTCSPAIDIEKSTNDQDADQATGPVLAVGSGVTWKYVVTNIGNTNLDAVQVTDDQLGSVNCPDSTLAPGASTTCTRTGTAQAGQYSNSATVTATHAGRQVTDTDPSHYLGGSPGLEIEKQTNGVDADSPPGPTIEAGSAVNWTYSIRNTGDLVLTDVAVTDSVAGVVVTCPPAASVLDPGEVQVCTASGTATDGQYMNTGTVTGTPPIGGVVTRTDNSHYNGVTPSIDLEKSTNTEDADTAPGPRIPVGDQVTWRYVVTNTGDTSLAPVGVRDDRLGTITTCPKTSLNAGETMTCVVTGIATAGQYSNSAIAFGASPSGKIVSDNDPSHYLGAEPGLALQKSTNGADADSPPGQTIEVGDAVTWLYTVTNTGNETLTGISITDAPMPAGGITCDSTTLVPGQSTSCHATGTATLGLFANEATATGTPPSGPAITSPPDPSHYTGVGAGIDIEKATNGEDADNPTGPTVAVGSTVNWTYVVTNTGDLDLTDVTVVDDQGVTVDCPTDTLAVGADMTCTASGTAVAGQYANLGTVTALTPSGRQVTDNDPSHYFAGNPSIDLEKKTNGFDADTGTGPAIPVNDPVNWTYLVTNNGNQPLDPVTVVDNPVQIINCPQAALAVGESMICTATGTAVAGQYENEATATGTPPTGGVVTHKDTSHYFGGNPGIDIEKLTNQQDADSAPGPIVLEGDSVTWTYRVRNIGNQTLTNVTVEDDQLADDSVINCGEGTDNVISDLAPAEVVLCTASDTAVAGQYANEATVTGTTPGLDTVIDRDPSHYFGAHPSVSFEKRVNGLDADTAPGPQILEGDRVTWTFVVQNTGNEALADVTVVDDKLGAIACPQNTLAIGEQMICEVQGVATIGQHENTATVTVTPPSGTPLEPVPDKGHYFGAHPGITLVKTVDGDDANSAPGPKIPAGDTVTFAFLITNTGNEPLTDIVLTDDVLGPISCPRTDLDASGGANDAMTCTATATALPGQHANTATVTAVPSTTGGTIHVPDPGHYFGTVPGIDIEKSTNGVDADDPTGPEVPVGDQVDWDYVVSNTGTEMLIGIQVTDDKIGDICVIPTLPAGANATCSAFSQALPGQYENTATAVGTGTTTGKTVQDRDKSHYFGNQPGLTIVKRTNGEVALSPPGPTIAVGDTVTWTYVLTNTGNQPLSAVNVTDSDPDVTPSCPQATLAVGESITCTATGTAEAGQYQNTATGTGTPPGGTPLEPTTTGHYVGSEPGLTLVKKTNGDSADNAPGPLVLVGDPITWEYEVTNTGNLTLRDVAVTDDQGVTVSCPLTELAPNGQPGDSMTCTASGTATAGQYSNTGTAVGTPPVGPVLRVPNTSHYFGAEPGIGITKLTNGELIPSAPGNTLRVGDAVTWTYIVTNTGNVALDPVSVTDDQGVTVNCPQATLAVGETINCTGSGIVTEGDYANQATATGQPPVGPPVQGITTSWYNGAEPGISLVKKTNGEDAKTAPGPYIPVGDPVTWTYEVTNTGAQTLTDIAVTDDQGVVVTCPDTTLAPGASTLCTAPQGIAVAGQYGNAATATGQPPTGPVVKSPDTSHYFGAEPSIRVEKLTNGDDADTPTGPLIAVGDTVSWRYIVTNDGNLTLTDVGVIDSDIGPISCSEDLLAPGATITCSASGTAVAGQYSNLATATGTPPGGLTPPTHTDPSHYFGPTPAIDIEKSTNGDDADTGTGPLLAVGDTATFSYLVTNTGDVALNDVTVTDDRLADAAISCEGGGNVIASLAIGAQASCTASTTVTAGQYVNIATATGTPPAGATPPTSTDPSRHFGAQPALVIEKATNGDDADTAPGPLVEVGSTVNFGYQVTNTGNVALTDVTVTDDQLLDGAIDCGDGTNVIASLAVGASASCSASTIAVAGQYTNVGTVTATPPAGLTPPTHTDPSNHFGATPGIDIEKATNGEDADAAPGPIVAVGSPVTWTYRVENTGNEQLTGVTVTDDKVAAAAIDCGEGSGNVINDLDPGEVVNCQASGTAAAGQYTNVGSVVTDVPPGGGEPPRDTDPSNHLGATPGIDIEKATNGEDADTAPGPFVPVGDLVSFSYLVTNTGNVDLTNVEVTDDKGVAVTCPSGNPIPLLAVGDSETCTGSTTAVAGLYTNVGTATGTPPPGLTPPTHTDPSNHYGARPGIELEKATDGIDADAAPGPVVPVGETVTWTYRVRNTGNVSLTDVIVTDDQLDDDTVIDCGAGADNVIPLLLADQVVTCTASAEAQAGQYTNIGTATGTPPGEPGLLEPPISTDPSNHFGGEPGIDIEKASNGQDADTSPGPYVPVGGTVTWTYRVENTGNETLTDVTVTDDQIAKDKLAIDCGEGTDNVIADLLPGEVVLCTATGTAVAGQYTNVATVTGTPPDGGTPPIDQDPSNHFGATPALDIEKLSNGQDADEAPGPTVAVGAQVSFLYIVSNTGNVDLTDVLVTDDQGVAVSCNGGNPIPLLVAGAVETCSGSTIATEGLYTNVGTATGTPPGGLTPPLDRDPSNHTGAASEYDLALRKTVASQSDTPLVPGISSVTFDIEVFNQGDVPASDVIIIDYVQNGFTYDPFDNTQSALPGNPNDWSPDAEPTLLIPGPIQPGNSVTVQIVLGIDVGTSGQALDNYSEIIESDGNVYTDVDSTPDNINGNDVLIDNVIDNSGGDEDDHDIASVQVGVFDLALRKTVAAVSDDPAIPGSTIVTFAIKVFNQGDVQANDVRIVDYVPLGFTFIAGDNTAAQTGNANDWLIAGADPELLVGSIAPHSSLTLQIRLRLDLGTEGQTLLNFAEISADGVPPGTDIDSVPDNINGNELGPVKDDVITEDAKTHPGVDDEDDHDVAPFTVNAFDLALRKRIGTLSDDPLVPGSSTVTFTIEVINQGEVTASDIELVDYVYAGFDFDAAKNTAARTGNANNWTELLADKPKLIIPGPINPGQSTTARILLDLEAGTDGQTVENYAEISNDNQPPGTDVDSTPDDIDQETPVKDDVVDEHAKQNPGIDDEDDHDVALVPVPASSRTCDIDNDGDIDRLDISLHMRLNGQTVPPAPEVADPDGDGVVTFRDVKICIPRMGT